MPRSRITRGAFAKHWKRYLPYLQKHGVAVVDDPSPWRDLLALQFAFYAWRRRELLQHYGSPYADWLRDITIELNSKENQLIFNSHSLLHLVGQPNFFPTPAPQAAEPEPKPNPEPELESYKISAWRGILSDAPEHEEDRMLWISSKMRLIQGFLEPAGIEANKQQMTEIESRIGLAKGE